MDRLTAERCLAEDTPESLVLAVRSDIARELLAKETAEYRKALQVECEETIEAERAEAESAATEPVITPVTQAEYVKTSSSVCSHTHRLAGRGTSSQLSFSHS